MSDRCRPDPPKISTGYKYYRSEKVLRWMGKRKYDWKTIQFDLDQGLTWRQLKLKYGCSFGAMADARSRGELRTRTWAEVSIFNSQTNIGRNEWENLSWEDRKRLIYLEQNGCCKECSLDSWRGKSLTLELEHCDGDRTNDSRENLIYLCPNCHSQTLTWRGRNKNKGSIKISDDELKQAIDAHNNIHQVLTHLGLAPKGGNYNRVRKFWYLKNISVSHGPVIQW